MTILTSSINVVGGTIQVNSLPGVAGALLTSNGASAPVWNTKIIVGAHLSANAVAGTAGVALPIINDVVDFDTTSSYDNTTGVFTAPRDGYYNINTFARVTDFGAPNGNRIQCAIQKKIGGTFVLWAQTETVDFETNLKVGTGIINMIIYLLQGEEARTTVTMNGGGGWLLRGSAASGNGTAFLTNISINSVD
tara:strand:- start:282 stop:860 length:579 start_codon:yes stop_codon:yes gene_type:complete